MKIILALFLIIFMVVIIRLIFVQVINGDYYKQKAYQQQTNDTLISANRGTIYDINNQELAISASVETIVVNPPQIKTDEARQKIAKYFSDNYSLDYDTLLATVSKKTQSSLVIMKKVGKEVTDEVRKWISEEKIKGISFIEDVKRYYPYGSLASHILGFCGTDNQGLYGIELKYENYLKGVPGRVVTTKDANSNDLPLESERYINSEDGNNIVLTIDATIQHITENYLSQAIEEYNCLSGGTAIVMRPSTGEILAMSSQPDYNLNDPFTPTDEDVLKVWDNLSTEERVKIRNEMWRNTVISSTYEPGSTFKLLTAAMAVEEKAVDTDKVIYTATGVIRVGGWPIHCWRSYNPHGAQTLAQGLQNSCNPLFVYVGSKIGTTDFYKYLRSFGLMERTGIDLPSESTSTFWEEKSVVPADLAVMSFGQRFEITPLQLITAISALANDGTLMKPMIVKRITDSNGNIVTEYEPTEVRQAVSKETADKLLEYAESVVSLGTGKRAQIVGYKIGGKTGTAEQGTNDDHYVASFVGIAPAYNPEFIVLVTLKDPGDKNNRQGGVLGATTAKKIMSDILSYLEIPMDYDIDAQETNGIKVPDVRTKTITEGMKLLKTAGFNVEIDFDGDKNATSISDQLPVPGTLLKKGSIIKLYAADNDVRVSVEVPSVIGKTAAEAEALLKKVGLNIKISGTGKVVTQDPPSGTNIEEGTVIRVEMDNLTELH
ncbi:MAG: penicillin-binding transpeptidase domain-containing protein [Clostridia bacterium]|nr:penicillin-binding transpeptidase domain-containing protein [Clostridia bacterium]